jgi:hypothetical protein
MYQVGGGKAVMETMGTTFVIPKVVVGRNRARASIDKARQGINVVAGGKQQEIQAQDTSPRYKPRRELPPTRLPSKLADRYMNEYAYLAAKASTANQTRRLLDRAIGGFGERPPCARSVRSMSSS